MVAGGVRWSGDWSSDGMKILVGLEPTSGHVTESDHAESRALYTANAMLVGGAWRPGAGGPLQSVAPSLLRAHAAELAVASVDIGLPAAGCRVTSKPEARWHNFECDGRSGDHH